MLAEACQDDQTGININEMIKYPASDSWDVAQLQPAILKLLAWTDAYMVMLMI